MFKEAERFKWTVLSSILLKRLVEGFDSSFQLPSNTADCDGNFKQKWVKLQGKVLQDLWIIQISDGIWKEIPSTEVNLVKVRQ